MILQRLIASLLILLLVVPNGIAANIYIRDGGTGDGSAWDNALDDLPATLTRGNTYYIADGNYATYTFNDAVSGGTLITIKKATGSDHGTETGWVSTYGDGSAVFATEVIFTTSNWVFDGNGTHTIPTNHLNAYGFIVGSATTGNNAGIVEFGSAGNTVSNITFRYVAATNTVGGETVGNVTVMVRFYPSQQHHHISLRNCWFKNSGKDGIQCSDSYAILVERCYIERLGRLLESGASDHGQTVQMFSSNFPINNYVFRWNTWDSCEGQSLAAYVDDGNASANSLTKFRFYGNVVVNPFGTEGRSAGFNTSGGILGNAWDGQGVTNGLCYNNTFVNLRDSFVSEATTTTFPIHAGTSVVDFYRHNNLFYNCDSSGATSWTTDSHNASGGLGTAGGTSEQTGLSSTIFVDYEGNDFRLASETDAPKDVTTIPGFDTSADSFFGQLDYNEDMYGNPFTSRGAFAFAEAAPPAGEGPAGTRPRGFKPRIKLRP